MPDLTEQLSEQKRKVSFDTYDITVQQLITMLDEKSINIAPSYQRQYRWKPETQSRLIESFFLGIPVPSLFMAANADATWEVVDGMQRLSTLVHFAGNEGMRAKLALATPLEVTDLEKLTELNGKTFDKLPKSVQLQFLLRPVKVVTLSDKSDTVVRFDLFERLNTGGVALTDQEIRACIFRGEFNDLLEALAQSPNFKTAVRLSPQAELDGTREEYVLRFFAFYYDYKNFVHSVRGFLNDFMRAASKKFDYAHGQAIFAKAFSQLANALPRGVTRQQNKGTTPVNLFEAVAVGAALAIARHGTLDTKGLEKWIASPELRQLTTGATNSTKRVAERLEYCANKFSGK